MDQTDQTDFSDLQKEERYQNLAKSLKVTRLKTNAKSQLIPWSSCSSINGDPSDANYTLASQFSKTGSEIITSSRNLKNLIHKRSCYSPMATSSVKRFCVNEKNSNDKEIMPPPSSYGIRTPLKRTASADPPQERSKFSRQSTHDNNHFSEEKQTTHFDLNSSKDFSEGHVGGASDSQREKNSDRHFHRWRVFLNDRGELLIKGLLNNEIWARSKPVAEMLSPTKLKSKYQHTYYLHGNIIDEKNELPKYIYQKFYNGFPDDWRNVHVIWKKFVAQGCGENFRWPMDVNYSDDDLNSEITDITHMQKTEKKFQELSSMEKSTPQRSSGYSSDFPHERETTKTIDKARKNQSMGNNFTVITEEFSEKENRSPHESRNQTNMTMDTSCSGKLYTALHYALSLKDIIFENKLTFITQNLLHEKCPKEYVQCVSRTIRDLNNILSVKIGDQDENTLKKFMDNLRTKDSENFTPASSLAQDDDYTSRIDECEANSEKLTKNNSNDINEKLMRQIITDKIVQENDTEGLSKNKNKEYALNSNIEKNLNLNFNAKTKTQETDSESEIYAGVPKISEKILQSKIYHKRQRRIDTNGKSRIRSTNKESKNDLHYDSSVSILEDEFHKNTTDNERIVRVDSKNLKTTGNHSKVDDFIKERRADPLRENHVIDNNKSSSKIPLFSKLPNTNNDNKKLIVNKENIEDDNDTFQRREDYSDSTQRKEIQNQKPIITNTENVNFHNFKKPQNPTIEQNPHVLKQSQVRQNQEEKIGEIGKNSSQDTFGSVENPKILTNWIPLVTFVGNKCQLVFEGTLLNSVGQLMKKKLTTSQVVKRISTSTIETSDHQFYKLLGEISVKKHVVPKELLPHCRTGCPVNIDQFCSSWLKLRGENNLVTERAQNSDDEKKYVPISSRGRNIRSPMKYWSGERNCMKDGDIVYVSGDPKEKFVTSTNDSPQKNRNKHKSHFYAFRKRQKISYQDYDDDENYPIIQKGTEKPKQMQRGRNSGPMIHLTYEKKTGKEDITLSDDQISVI
ncbi:TNF receptor-associated factor family protein DDB_G0272098-like isoform X2 [Leptopilina heterotoma]|uniref:TNF receptor-associated factor family protein DDB_G0272098-like isoform X2 n=1 Tax=Leptopilina heterotoma TaxID=63436 RepID=UPI001CA87C39|nr:TNF receptor-associated factor family protein DDB_G0272098-like isoform X2 [Leptopilina heterotoma]